MNERPTLDLSCVFDVNLIDQYETHVELRQSTVCTGQGLFATADIQKGATITHYPCHCILQVSHSGEGFILGQANDYRPWTTEYNELMNYSYTLTTNGHDGSYYQVADPKTPFQPHLAAHYINDCVKFAPMLARVATADGTVRNWLKYNKAAAHANAAMNKKEDGMLCVVSTKDIKKDEEILTSYGFPYWMRVSDPVLKKRLRDCKDKVALKKLFDLTTIAKAYS